MICAVLCARPALAEAPGIEGATAARGGDTWHFDVTLSHPDTGWRHYADGWRIEDTEGRVLGTRALLHPHVTEQPFTRSLGGVELPENQQTVLVRARCNVDGWSETTLLLDLPR